MSRSESVEIEAFAVPIRIGVVADTHLGNPPRGLPAPLVAVLRDVDLILHAGDICTAAALELFLALGPPVRAVVGNNDSPSLGRLLPRERRFTFGPFTAGMIHGHDLPRLTARQAAERTFVGKVDLGIVGHSHIPLCERVGGTLLLNPGSALQRRWQPRHSLALVQIADRIDAEIRYLPY